jgi:hypothetical protein
MQVMAAVEHSQLCLYFQRILGDQAVRQVMSPGCREQFAFFSCDKKFIASHGTTHLYKSLDDARAIFPNFRGWEDVLKCDIWPLPYYPVGSGPAV